MKKTRIIYIDFEFNHCNTINYKGEISQVNINSKIYKFSVKHNCFSYASMFKCGQCEHQGKPLFSQEEFNKIIGTDDYNNILFIGWGIGSDIEMLANYDIELPNYLEAQLIYNAMFPQECEISGRSIEALNWVLNDTILEQHTNENNIVKQLIKLWKNKTNSSGKKNSLEIGVGAIEQQLFKDILAVDYSYFLPIKPSYAIDTHWLDYRKYNTDLKARFFEFLANQGIDMDDEWEDDSDMYEDDEYFCD